MRTANRICPDRAAGFSLVEVALAVGVAGFCLVAIFGLLPVGFNSNQSAIEQTLANGILSEVTADLRATPPTPLLSATSQQFGIVIPANPVTTSPASTTLYFTGAGQFSTTFGSQSRELLTITFLPNGSSSTTVPPSLKPATFVNQKVTWPAGANPASPAGSVQTFVALDRN